MLTPEELKFFTENKDKITDLIRAVDHHEQIRAQIGPGNILGYPHLIPDYTRAHDIMSRLSLDLQMSIAPNYVNVGPLNAYDELPARFTFTTTIVGSC